VILSTILLRLGFAATILPSVSQVLVIWLLLSGYCSIAIPTSLHWGLASLETIQVWWNLQLYAYGVRLRNNRRAIILMVGLLLWLSIEEILLRVAVIPSMWEQMPTRYWWSMVLLSWLLSILKYPWIYGQLNGLFRKPGLWFLGALLELFCTLTYLFTNSLWLTLWFHWTIAALWLLPFGGKYLLWCHKKNYPQKIFKGMNAPSPKTGEGEPEHK
jgi:predicted Abi (CAAX) family protease